MKIEELKISNFRSFGKEVTIQPLTNTTIFIGENNTGKSNVLLALDHFKRDANAQFTKEDFYKEKVGKEINISVTIQLSNSEMIEFTNELFKGWSEFNSNLSNRIRKELGNKVCITISTHQVGPLQSPPFISIAGINIWNNLMSTDLTMDEWQAQKLRSLSDAITKSGYPNGDTIIQIISKTVKPQRIALGTNSTKLLNLIFSNYEQFHDVRTRPQGGNATPLITGNTTGEILQALKNSENDSEMERWHKIQYRFAQLFPGLKLESVRGNKIQVKDANSNFKGFQESLGMGHIEIITMLTHFIGRDDCVFIIDEPELHLHPIAQRLLWEIIEDGSLNNQFFIVTHSPWFIDIKNIYNNIRIGKRLGNTRIFNMNPTLFSDEEKSKICSILSPIENREIFFARKVLIVEEETAKVAIPIFAQKLGKDFNKSGIIVIDVRGKDGMKLPIMLLRKLKIPYYCMCDYDALMSITSSVQGVQTSSILSQLYKLGSITLSQIRRLTPKIVGEGNNKHYVVSEFQSLKNLVSPYHAYVLNGNFEKVLINSGFSRLMDEAKEAVGRRSKPRVSQYVAERISKDEIPQQFKDVISKISRIKYS